MNNPADNLACGIYQTEPQLPIFHIQIPLFLLPFIRNNSGKFLPLYSVLLLLLTCYIIIRSLPAPFFGTGRTSLHKVITCQFSTLNYFAIFLHSPVANCCRDPSVFLSLIPFTILLYFYCQHRLSGSRIICVDCLTNGFPFPNNINTLFCPGDSRIKDVPLQHGIKSF